jgi:hypothetical protein
VVLAAEAGVGSADRATDDDQDEDDDTGNKAEALQACHGRSNALLMVPRMVKVDS